MGELISGLAEYQTIILILHMEETDKEFIKYLRQGTDDSALSKAMEGFSTGASRVSNKFIM